MKIIVSSVVDMMNSAPNRIHQIVSRLAERHSVKVICIGDSWKSRNVEYCKLNNFADSKNIEIDYPINMKISPIIQEIISPVSILLKNITKNYDIHFNYNSLFLGAAIQDKLGKKVPVIYDIADDLAGMIRTSPQITPILRPIGGLIGNKIINYNIKRSSYVTYTCPELKDTYNFSSDNSLLLPNGVDTKLFNFSTYSYMLKKELGLDKVIVLGYVGVLREWVDFSPVFEVLARLSNIKLLIVGAEGNYSGLKTRVKELELADKVIFTGTIAYDEVPKFISCMDLALIPFKSDSVAKNALPLKLFEYLSCGCNVASTDLPAIKRIVGDSVHYYDNYLDLLNIIEDIIINPNAAKASTKLGRKIVIDNYSWDIITNKIERLMAKLLKQGQ